MHRTSRRRARGAADVEAVARKRCHRATFHLCDPIPRPTLCPPRLARKGKSLAGRRLSVSRIFTFIRIVLATASIAWLRRYAPPQSPASDTQPPVRPVDHLTQLQRLRPLRLRATLDVRGERSKRLPVTRQPPRPSARVPPPHPPHRLRRHLPLILPQVLQEIVRGADGPLADLALVPQLRASELAQIVQRGSRLFEVAILRQQRDANLGSLSRSACSVSSRPVAASAWPCGSARTRRPPGRPSRPSSRPGRGCVRRQTPLARPRPSVSDVQTGTWRATAASDGARGFSAGSTTCREDGRGTERGTGSGAGIRGDARRSIARRPFREEHEGVSEKSGEVGVPDLVPVSAGERGMRGVRRHSHHR